MKKGLEYIRFIMICLTIILIIISSIRITYYDISLYDYSLSLIINGSIHLIIYILSKIKNFKFKKEELFIFILMILSCLSLINCYDLKICLMGRIDRYEGLFVILTYYLLLLNSLNVKGKKEKYIIVILIILYGLLNTFYGMFQVNLLKTKFDIKNIFYYARGFVGNSMFFSSLISLCYPLILGFCLKEEKIKKLLFFYILLIILTIGVIISGSMSLYVGVILIYLVIIFDTIIHFKKDKFKNTFLLINTILIIIITVILFLFLSYRITPLREDILEFKKETTSIKEGEVTDNFGTGRIYIWKNTLKKIKENYLFGVGIDNFALAFDNSLIDGISGFMVDKAHNEYLQIMLCEGVIKGILYIVFLLIIFFKNLIKKKDKLTFALFLSFTCYCIQAFFNISVTRVFPLFFIILGLLISNNNANKIKNNKFTFI